MSEIDETNESTKLRRLLSYLMLIGQQVMFVVYSGTLLFTISAPNYLWFIWTIYQIIAWTHFLLQFINLFMDNYEIDKAKKL